MFLCKLHAMLGALILGYSPKTKYYVRQPYGQLMCKELGFQISGCPYSDYNIFDLTCQAGGKRVCRGKKNPLCKHVPRPEHGRFFQSRKEEKKCVAIGKKVKYVTVSASFTRIVKNSKPRKAFTDRKHGRSTLEETTQLHSDTTDV